MILPIFCFSFLLCLAQYESSLYAVAFFMGISYAIHKHTDQKKENDNLNAI